MPLTPFQKEVMSVLAAERHEASHMAGGLECGQRARMGNPHCLRFVPGHLRVIAHGPIYGLWPPVPKIPFSSGGIEFG
jgi:hypothetical protein